MQGTKEKILEESKVLFFEQGIANTRLMQIADATGISVGNLAYHFKNKEAIVEAVYENLFSDLTGILSKYMLYSNLEGFIRQFSDLYHFYEQNNFTFNNLWEIERNYPAIQKEWLSANNKILLQLKKRIDLSFNAGLIKAEPWSGYFSQLAQNLLLVINYSISQHMLLRKQVTEDIFKKNLWSLLYPNLTAKGVAAYKQMMVPDGQN